MIFFDVISPSDSKAEKNIWYDTPYLPEGKLLVQCDDKLKILWDSEMIGNRVCYWMN